MTNERQIRTYFVRHQLLVKAGFIFVAVLLIVVVGILPLVNQIGQSTKKLENRRKDEKALSEQVVLLTQMDQSTLNERAKIIRQALPEKKDVLAYLSSLQGLSRDLGVSFGGIVINPGNVSEESGVATKSKKQTGRKNSALQILDSEIKIVGNRDGIHAFLRQVEQVLPLMEVSNVKVIAIGEDLYSMTLSLGMLWSPYVAEDIKGKITLFNEKEEATINKISKFRFYQANDLPLPDQDTSLISRDNLFIAN